MEPHSEMPVTAFTILKRFAALCSVMALILSIGVANLAPKPKGYTKATLTPQINAGILVAEVGVMRAAPTDQVPAGVQKCESGTPGMAKDDEKKEALEKMAEVNLVRAECGKAVGDGTATATPAPTPSNPTPYQKSMWKKAGDAADAAKKKQDGKSADQKKADCKGGPKNYYHTAASCSVDQNGNIVKSSCPGCSAAMSPPSGWKATKTEEFGPFWDPLAECWRWILILHGVP